MKTAGLAAAAAGSLRQHIAITIVWGRGYITTQKQRITDTRTTWLENARTRNPAYVLLARRFAHHRFSPFFFFFEATGPRLHPPLPLLFPSR